MTSSLAANRKSRPKPESSTDLEAGKRAQVSPSGRKNSRGASNVAKTDAKSAQTTKESEQKSPNATEKNPKDLPPAMKRYLAEEDRAEMIRVGRPTK
ncbi:hypothetical protein B0A50_07846 [Salinomyces thailandicus]|uniref:Uncharacterized protein n=1 Tax=Salinomyces thailandicus TaxID=706561 RepID=A0A4U0TM34_9PEZI|nr:hypothetical protein B0A50_07846 [Salinomyces thailandica]